MKNRIFTASAAAAATLIAACGGGGGGAAPTTPPAAPAGAPSTETALDAAKAFLAAFDAHRAVPRTTGAAVTALNDGCYLENGRSKAFIIADFDADPLAVASSADQIGTTRNNVRVLADRTSTNADGTTRREIDIKYDVTYVDGSKFVATADDTFAQTIISGSSAGSKLADGTTCAAPETKSDWRFFGNRKIVNTFMSAQNERKERTLLATGVATAPPVVYSKFINLGVQDPANVATYATLSGPGIKIAGVDATLKLVSVRLLRDAPEFVGKNGHFVDWRDTDPFKVCRTAGGAYATADTADCVTNGATGDRWGFENMTTGLAADTGFDALGVVAGGDYAIKIYNDDGWKTVNGQAGKTPIATYTTKLVNLPFSAATLAGAAPASDLYAKVLTNSMTPADIATAIRGRGAFSVNLTYSQPAAMPDARALALGNLYTFKQGRQTVGQPNFNPASRSFDPTYPATSATAATVAVPAASVNLGLPTYAEITFNHGNRNGNIVRSLYTFQ